VASSKSVAKARSAAIGQSLGPADQGSQLSAQKIYKTIADEKIKKLNIILKADVQGSLEAIGQILGEIKSDEVAVDYIGTGIGNINESDVRLAQSTGAVVFGFSVEITPVAKRMAETGQVEIKIYKIIYELVSDIKNRLVEMLPPEIERVNFGKLQVLAIFKTGKKDMIVGGKVINGKVMQGSPVEVLREGQIIGKGSLANLQQNKVDTDEVKEGNECGITFLGETKIKEGDTLAFYKEEVKKKTL